MVEIYRQHHSRPEILPGPSAPGDNLQTVRVVLTVWLGVFIPVLSLVLSGIGGTLGVHGYWGLALLFGGIMGCVLGVSLEHLARAIQDITRAPWGSAWALAVALDLSLVAGELVHIFAPGVVWLVVSWGLMVAVCLTSMVLNCWAFFHPR